MVWLLQFACRIRIQILMLYFDAKDRSVGLCFTSSIHLTYLTLFTWWFMSKSLLFGCKLYGEITTYIYIVSKLVEAEQSFYNCTILGTFKSELTYLALSSNLTILSGASSLIACFSINQGAISSLTSSGIFDSRLVCSFIITQVLFVENKNI